MQTTIFYVKIINQNTLDEIFSTAENCWISPTYFNVFRTRFDAGLMKYLTFDVEGIDYGLLHWDTFVPLPDRYFISKLISKEEFIQVLLKYAYDLICRNNQ